MKVTLDLETLEMIVPKNFFATIEKENAIIEKAGGTTTSPVDRIRNAFTASLANTDKYLRTRK